MKRKYERGEVVVEASLIVTLVVIFISIMFYIGMILYQRSLVSVMANQTAASIAQSYSNTGKDAFTGYIDPESVYQKVTYGNTKTDSYLQKIAQKANVFAKYRLKSSRILPDGTPDIDVQIVKKPNELLKSQIVVKVRDTYTLPLVSLFGINGELHFSATGRADCVDILEYLNGVEAIGNPDDSNVTVMTKTCTVTFVSEGSVHATVSVLKGRSVNSSVRYTRSPWPSDPMAGAMRFVRWQDEDGMGFTADSTVNRNMLVYAQWECTVSLDACGGSVNPNQVKGMKGESVTLPTPNREGYDFIGWFTGRDAGGMRFVSRGSANPTLLHGNVTLYAAWTRKMFRVTYDANGGYLPARVASSVVVGYRDTVNLPDAKRTAFLFAGWFTAGGEQYYNWTPIVSNVTLYARWNTCETHVCGNCGVDHTVSYEFSWHAKSYYGTTMVRCLVCRDCGCFLDGKNNKVEDTLKKRYNSEDKIGPHIWCVKHKTESGEVQNDT